VHPSHRGTTYTRKPKKKKKKIKRAQTARDEHDAFFLAPAEPVVNGPQFDEEQVISQDGGAANSIEEYDG
jgi:hypothetical protein